MEEEVTTTTTSASDGPPTDDSNAHLYAPGEEPPQNDADPNNQTQKEASPMSYLTTFMFGIISTTITGKHNILQEGFNQDEYNPSEDCLFVNEVPRQVLGQNVRGRHLPVNRWSLWKVWQWTKDAFNRLSPYWQKAVANPNPAIQFIVRCIHTKIVLRVASCYRGIQSPNPPREGSLCAHLGGREAEYSGISPGEERKVRDTWLVSKFYGGFKQFFSFLKEAKKNEAQWLESKKEADEWTRKNSSNIADSAYLVFDTNSGETITDITTPLKVFTDTTNLTAGPPKGVGCYDDADGKKHPQKDDFTEENNYTFEMSVRGHGVSIKAVPLDGDEHNKWKDLDASAWDTLAKQLAKKKKKKCPLCPEVKLPGHMGRHFLTHGEGKLDAWLKVNKDHILEWVE